MARSLAAALDMLSLVDTVGGAGLVGLVPGGLFELLLPAWLFARGFSNRVGEGTRLPRSAK
jgi:hypothetical protein